MKKYKQFILGVIVGAMLFSSIGVFAEGFTVLLNPFPIFFNGQQANVEAYNVNGRTFLSLGDIATYFNATATLNETTKQIEVNNNEKLSTTSIEDSLITVIPFDIETEQPVGAEFTEYKGCRVLRYNNKFYVDSSDLYSTFKIIPIIIDENTRMFKLDNKKIVVSKKDYNNTIKYKMTYFYDISLFSKLIGE